MYTLPVRERRLILCRDDMQRMKKLFGMLLICTLFVLLIPSAQAAEGAVYPIPYDRIYYDGFGEYFDEGVDTEVEATGFADTLMIERKNNPDGTAMTYDLGNNHNDRDGNSIYYLQIIM